MIPTVSVLPRGFGVQGAKPETIRAVSTLQLAGNFAAAAELLLSSAGGDQNPCGGKRKPLFQDPALLCLARGIELTFKAYLTVAAGVKERKGHDLIRLHKQCRSFGLNASVDADEHLRILNRVAAKGPYIVAYSGTICGHSLDIQKLTSFRWDVIEQTRNEAQTNGAKIDGDAIRWAVGTGH